MYESVVLKKMFNNTGILRKSRNKMTDATIQISKINREYQWTGKNLEQNK